MIETKNTIEIFELLNITAEAVARDLNDIVNLGGKIISVYKTTRYSRHLGDLDCIHVVVDVRDMNTKV